MSERFPLLECTASNPDTIANFAASLYSQTRTQSSAAKRARDRITKGTPKHQCRKAVPVLLTALETKVPYTPNPTPTDILEAKAELQAAASAAFGPVALWLLGQLLQWLIPVLIRWWFSSRSRQRRVAAARAKGGA